jgi:ribosomal protein S18 acetylase RimI-like enzyme
MREKGCSAILVTVADGNEAALPFYEKLGFRVRRTVLQLKK